MIVFDLLLVVALLLTVEVFMMGENYWNFSPVMVLLGCFVFLYAGPYCMHIHVADVPLLESLADRDLSWGVNLARLFLVVWAAVMFPLLFRLRDLPRNRINTSQNTIPDHRLLMLLACYMPLYLLYLGSGVDYKPGLMLDRFLNPRAYTYIKSGFGPLIWLKWAMSNALIYIMMAAMFQRPQAWLPKLLVPFMYLLLLGGGTKSDMLVPVLMFLILRQKYAENPGGSIQRLSFAAVTGSLGVVLVMLAFGIYSTDKESDPTVILERIAGYVRESYYLPVVTQDYEWRPEYPQVALLDTAVAPVPRVVWPDKPLCGFYRRYWQPHYEPWAVVYQTTTFGSLLEAHMLFGVIGIPIYAVIFALFCYWLYRKLLVAEHLGQLYLPIFLSAWLFSTFRNGFTGMWPWFVLLVGYLGRIMIDYTLVSVQPDNPGTEESHVIPSRHVAVAGREANVRPRSAAHLQPGGARELV